MTVSKQERELLGIDVYKRQFYMRFMVLQVVRQGLHG